MQTSSLEAVSRGARSQTLMQMPSWKIQRRWPWCGPRTASTHVASQHRWTNVDLPGDSASGQSTRRPPDSLTGIPSSAAAEGMKVRLMHRRGRMVFLARPNLWCSRHLLLPDGRFITAAWCQVLSMAERKASFDFSLSQENSFYTSVGLAYM